MKKDYRVHSGLLAMVGGYMMIIARQMYDNMRQGSQDMSHTAFICVICFFVLAGLGVLGYGWYVWTSGRKQEKQAPADEEKDDGRD